MADDKGSVEIDVVVDASEAIDGFKKAGEAASEMAEKLEETEKRVKEAGKELSDAKEDAKDLGDGFEKLGESTKHSSAFIEDMKKRLGDLTTEATEAETRLKDLGDEIEDLPTPEPPKKPIKDSLPTDDDIEGLSRFRDTTGEADSAIAGMAAAADHLSPELASMMRVVGDASGGMEAASRATALFGGSLGSLVRIGGPVALALGAIAFAHSKMKSAAKKAEEALEKQHEEMKEGIRSAKAYEARMRSVRVTLGTLSAEEERLRNARDEAADGLGKQTERMQQVRDRTAALQRAYNRNTTAINEMQMANASANITFINSMDALEGAGRAARGEAADFDMTSASASQLRIDSEELSQSTIEIGHALELGRKEIARYDRALKRDQAQILISNAIRSGEIDLMVEAADQLENLEGGLRESAEAQLLQAIATEEAAQKLEEEANAAEKSVDANDDLTKSIEDQIQAREKLDRMLAGTGKAPEGSFFTSGFLARSRERELIELDYLAALKEVEQAVKDAGGTEEEFTRLFIRESHKRAQALNDYEASLEDVLDTSFGNVNQNLGPIFEEFETEEQRVMNRSIELEKTKSQMIQAEYDSRLASLIVAKSKEEITQAQFDEQEKIAAKKQNAALLDLRKEQVAAMTEQAQSNLENVQQFTGAFLNLINAQIDAVNAKLDAEKEQALKRVQSGSEEAEKIEREFEFKRQQALKEAYKKRQNMEIANAIISGAAATVGALAPAPTGFGPNPAGIAMALLVASTTAMQIAAIQAQNPKFHSGGIVGGDGDQPITAQGGEVVLNREAVSMLGGPDAANSLNSGGMGGGTTVIQMTYKQKVFDQVVIDNLAKGGPLKNALNTATRRGRRGRVGGRL